MNCSGEIPFAHFEGFQVGEIAEEFFLAAGGEGVPSGVGFRRAGQCRAKRIGHGVHWAVAVVGIELEFDGDAVADFGGGGFADDGVEVEVKAAVAGGHHVDSPGGLGFVVDADEDGEGVSPIGFQGVGAGARDEDVGVDAADLDFAGEVQGHIGRIAGRDRRARRKRARLNKSCASGFGPEF